MPPKNIPLLTKQVDNQVEICNIRNRYKLITFSTDLLHCEAWLPCYLSPLHRPHGIAALNMAADGGACDQRHLSAFTIKKHCALDCTARHLSECPYKPLFIAESAYNGHRNIRIGSRSSAGRWPGLMNHTFFYIMRMADCACPLPAEEMVPGRTNGRRKVRGSSIMLWAIFCW